MYQKRKSKHVCEAVSKIRLIRKIKSKEYDKIYQTQMTTKQESCIHVFKAKMQAKADTTAKKVYFIMRKCIVFDNNDCV